MQHWYTTVGIRVNLCISKIIAILEISYLTNTMPIIGGEGGGGGCVASLIFANGKMLGAIQAIFKQIFLFLPMQMLPKIFVKTPAGGCLFYG